jgi:hypothetical protein
VDKIVNTPDFAVWQHETLAQFATEAYAKLQEQDDTIQQLQRDLKDAISAYRKLLILHEDDGR